jgi:hypothetical protein
MEMTEEQRKKWFGEVNAGEVSVCDPPKRTRVREPKIPSIEFQITQDMIEAHNDGIWAETGSGCSRAYTPSDSERNNEWPNI